MKPAALNAFPPFNSSPQLILALPTDRTSHAWLRKGLYLVGPRSHSSTRSPSPEAIAASHWSMRSPTPRSYAVAFFVNYSNLKHCALRGILPHCLSIRHPNNSMRHGRIFFIFTTLKSITSALQNEAILKVGCDQVQNISDCKH